MDLLVFNDTPLYIYELSCLYMYYDKHNLIVRNIQTLSFVSSKFLFLCVLYTLLDLYLFPWLKLVW